MAGNARAEALRSLENIMRRLRDLPETEVGAQREPTGADKPIAL
jgi:hypothetical protein